MVILGKIRKFKIWWNGLVKSLLRRTGIFTRLSVAFFLPLMALLFVVLFSYYQYFEEINNNLDRYASLLLQNVALKVKETMQDYEDIARLFYDDIRIIQAIAENGEFSSEEETEQYEKNCFLIENKLYNVGYNQKHIVNMQFVTPFRQYCMAESKGFQRGGTIRDMDSFYDSVFYLLPQEKRGRPVWIDDALQVKTFYKNEQNLYGFGNIITLGVAVYHPKNREFLGVLLMNIDLKAFSDAAGGYEIYNDGNIFLAGSGGVLMGFQPSLSAPSYPMEKLIFSEMIETPQRIIRTQIGGEDIFLAYEKVPDTNVFTVYIADLAVLLERPRRARNLCAAAFLCTVAACIIISYYVTVSISDPVEQLVQVMQKAGDGKWKLHYENDGHDEISLLGDRFNEMAEKTNRLIEQVYLLEIKRQKLLLSQKNAQMDALLMQINPHFLYNTLDIIRWEAMYEAGGESRVTQMIEKFSRLCRMSMRMGSETICLEEGLLHAQTYLEVINFRHSNKIQMDIRTEVDSERMYIPRFLLQPFMENAVVHAFDGSGSKGSSITIHTFEEDDILHIVVRDNGKGMSPEQVSRLEKTILCEKPVEESIGLANVNQRIRLFYGISYGIRIKSELGQGTEIETLLPVRDHSENMEEMEGGQEKGKETGGRKI